MFDIGWSELVVIAIVALIAIGPKELPGVLRTVGLYMGKIRRMASEFQGQFQEAMREAEMGDIKKQVDEMTSAASDFTGFDPLADVQKEFDAALTDKPPDTPATATPAPEATAPSAPAPVSPDPAIPQPAADVAIAPEAPRPKDEAKSGSGG